MKHFKTLALAFCAAALLVGCSTKDAKEDVMKNTKSFIDDVKDKVNVTGVEYYTGESLFYNASDNDPQVLVGDGTIVHISADTKDGKKANMYYSIKEDGKMEEIVKFAKDEKGKEIPAGEYAIYSAENEVKDWQKLSKEEVSEIAK